MSGLVSNIKSLFSSSPSTTATTTTPSSTTTAPAPQPTTGSNSRNLDSDEAFQGSGEANKVLSAPATVNKVEDFSLKAPAPKAKSSSD
jgi:hypothetical protein